MNPGSHYLWIWSFWDIFFTDVGLIIAQPICLEKFLQKLKIFCANMGWAKCQYLKTQNNWKTCIFSVEFLKTPNNNFSYWCFLHPGVSTHACKLVCLYELPKKMSLLKREGPDRGKCFITSTSLTLHLFLLGWLKLNAILLLDQLRLT